MWWDNSHVVAISIAMELNILLLLDMIDQKYTQNCLGVPVDLLQIPLQKFVPKSICLIAWTSIFYRRCVVDNPEKDNS